MASVELEEYSYSLRWIFDNQETHEIDAKTLLRSEQALLDYLHYLSKEFNLPFNMKIKARKEGSFKTEHVVEFLNQNRDVILIFLTAALAKFFAPNPKPKDSNASMTQFVIDVQEKVSNGTLTKEQAEAFIESSSIPKKQKNAFFKANKANKEIKFIEIRQGTDDVTKIPSENFLDYIAESSNNEDIIYNAKIYIISPVIVKGSNEVWSGEYDGEKIRFYVRDKEFLEKSQNKVISFNTGFYIVCNLRKSIKLIDGREQKKWDVIEVVNYATDENHVFEFNHKRKKGNKYEIEGQLSLFESFSSEDQNIL